MNHELVMLRGALRMKKSVKQMEKTVKNLAIKSYAVANWRDGTMGQVQAICNTRQTCDKLMSFYDGVILALKNIPKGYRALICEVYLLGTDKGSICQKYGISLSTLYRYLAKGRKFFKRQLEELGLTEVWLYKNFSSVEWIGKMLKNNCKGRPLK